MTAKTRYDLTKKKKKKKKKKKSETDHPDHPIGQHHRHAAYYHTKLLHYTIPTPSLSPFPVLVHVPSCLLPQMSATSRVEIARNDWLTAYQDHSTLTHNICACCMAYLARCQGRVRDAACVKLLFRTQSANQIQY